ncbi:MAG: hypothetical protein IPK60_14455 [Sandaracinaceae bacterium]|jgi:hypothetical protein|nr:hypothetical protein [Sandaracinaceae bacterium]
MTQQRREGIRNDVIAAALPRALASDDRKLFDLLTRASVAPGLRLHSELALGFADELVRLNHPRTLSLLREMTQTDAKPHAPEEFLLIAAAHGFGALVRMKRDVRPAWAELKDMADDERALVRASVAEAIGTVLVRLGNADSFLIEAQSWMDDFFTAAVALETLTQKHVMATVQDPEAMLGLLDQGVSMIEKATRASERRPGRRRLLDVLPQAVATCVAAMRGGQDWLVARAQTRDPDLRETFEKALGLLGRKGAHTAELEAVVNSLDTSKKPRRDPLTDVGPTRGRSKKHRGRSR